MPKAAAPAAPVALVPAAGAGVRFGGSTPKQLLEIAGRPLLAWTLDRLRAGGAGRLVVALPAAELASATALGAAAEGVVFVAGGSTRQESVARCLAASGAGPDELVLVHDGARPAIAPADVRAVIAACAGGGGAILGRPVADTLKRVAGGRVEATVDRAGLFRAETPQAFPRGVLERALAAAARDGFTGTDEAALVERLGGVAIAAVPASAPNPKLTEPSDLPLITALLLA